MYVLKRDGRKETVHFDKITSRIRKLCYGLDQKYVDPTVVAQKVCQGVYKGVTTTELDELAAETSAHMMTEHPDYGKLAARIEVSNLHKNTCKSFFETITKLYTYKQVNATKTSPLIADDVYEIIKKNQDEISAAIVYERDFEYNYFGFKTLQRSYLLKLEGKIVERPQQMLMRVSVGIHKEDIKSAIETYNYMSQGFFTHASPTLFNSGTPRPQLSSCFLLAMKEDSIEGIYDTLKRCAQISKSAGGIGLSVHNIRATGSYIAGTNGNSNGLVPMLRVFNNTARYVDQGGGKRKGAFAIYLEPWHADVFDFLELRKNHGKEELRARDLFYALWINDEFMRRVETNKDWSLFCPHEAPGLADCFGDKFDALYKKYESEGRARRIVKARALWQAIIDSQTETGTPYMLFKDACNRKSNQQNLGTIKSSNLCTEIIEYTSPDEVAVCNLASIALPKYVDMEKGVFDHEALFKVTKHVTKNLNKVIDVNFYPVKEAYNSNMRHRPIGIGIQGLADTFMMLRLPFESDKAKALNKEIFETIYFAALTASNEVAQKDGPYPTYILEVKDEEGKVVEVRPSPVAKGILQFDMWGVKPTDRWDWDKLRADIKKSGVRNSLLVAPMPTASTSQILGNNECFEPYTSNLYLRRTLAGEFVTINRHLLLDLLKQGLWDDNLKNRLVANKGSVQNKEVFPEISQEMRDLYKTVWEISGKTLMDLAADRGAFIDQSQSLNVHMPNVNYGKLTSLHFYAWKKGLKTGMYYLRTKAAANAIQFTVDKKALASTATKKEGEGLGKPKNMTVEEWRKKRAEAAIVCSLENKDACVSCGS